MKKHLVLILLHVLALVGLALPPTAAAADWTASWESIRQAAETVRGVQARFVQEKHLQILAAPLVAHGALAFQRPDALRWEYDAPLASVLLMQGAQVRRFVYKEGAWVPDDSPSLQAMRFVVQDISRWMTGRFDANPDFAAELRPAGRIVLTPRSEGLASVITRIELQLAAAPGAIQEVQVYEDDANYTRLIFEDVQLNPDLPPTLFENPA